MLSKQEIAMHSVSQSSMDCRSRFPSAYQVLDEAIAAKTFPGCAFGVYHKGEVVLEDALGRFTYDSDSPSVTPETIFDLASVSKVVATTSAAMLLYQRGLLELDTPLGEFLPGFVVGRDTGSSARSVTIRHLLAHNSGLPGYVEFFKSANAPSQLYRACLSLELEAAPGTRSEYSDPGFILLGKALEVVTREYLATWVKREVLDALKMSSSHFCPPAAIRATIPPTEIDQKLRNRVIQGEVQDENAWLLKGAAGHAGLFSNVHDLLLFAREILHSDHGGGSLFNRETLSIFTEKQPPEGSSRALGWDTPSENSSSGSHFGPRSIGHLGYSGCSLWIDRDAQLAVVLLTNRTWPDRANQQIKLLRPQFHNALRSAL